jgi:acyl-CoA synthetase (AMP-forming)/AMP-acid ligase II
MARLRRTTYAQIAPARLRSRSGSAARASRSATGWRRWPGTRDRHLELWYGISGIGAITHTVNPRLFPEQIAWIIDHAGDRMLFLDLTFVPLVEQMQDKLPSVERFIVLTDAAPHA